MRLFIIFTFLFLPLTTLADVIKTEGNKSVEEVFIEIQEMEDKRLVVEGLQKLLTGSTLTVKQRLKIGSVLSKNQFMLGEFDKAILTIENYKLLAKQNNLYRELANADNTLGIFYYYQGKYKQSLVHYQSSLVQLNALELTQEIATEKAFLLNNMALVQADDGDLSGALKSYQLAQPLFQNYGSKADLVDVKGNIATLYLKLSHYKKAKKLLEEVLAERILLGDEYGAAAANAHLGVVHKDLGSLLLAEKKAHEALEYFEKHEYPYEVAAELYNLSQVNLLLGNSQKAADFAKKSIGILKKEENSKGLAKSYQLLAQALYSLGNIEKAVLNLDISNEKARLISDESLLNSNLAFMSLIKSQDDDYKQALLDLKQYISTSKRLENEELRKQLSTFEASQLELEIDRLEQNEKLQKIEQKQENQQKNFIIIAIFFISLVAFLLYRRHLEVELTDTLEAKVKKRTTELVLLSERLVKADKIKSQFVANMSHEIRTPLTAVIGHTEGILYGDYQESELDSEVKIIHNNSLHLLGIVNDVLDMSKIEEDKLALSLSDEKIQDILTTLKGMFTKPAKRKKVLFTIDSQIENPLIVRIDSARLKQILINLCSNALKFTNQGEVKLTVEIAKNNLVFTVKDSGIGIDKEQQKNIFGSFNQADESISRHFGGTGLGLYISNQLAKMMNGTISVTSEVGKGSQFTFSMPVETAVKEIELTQQNQQATPTSSEDNSYHLDTSIVSKARSKYRGQVILAEDHQENRQFIARMLTNLGLEVLEAANGLDVLSLCESYQVNAIFMDIQMPKMDGVSTLSQLKELNYPAPIYALTANAMVHEVEMYLEKGFTGHLSKPIDRAKFIAVVDEHFEKKPVNAEEPSKAVKESAGTTDSSSKNDDEISSTDLKAKFISSLVQSKASIESLMHENNLAELTKEIHKLAGAAYVFEVIEIAQCASELETELKQGKPLNEELMACLLDEINAVTS
jgi:signal transduction histidine kinase/DNA-binding response OmpR family regulator